MVPEDSGLGESLFLVYRRHSSCIATWHRAEKQISLMSILERTLVPS